MASLPAHHRVRGLRGTRILHLKLLNGLGDVLIKAFYAKPFTNSFPPVLGDLGTVCPFLKWLKSDK